MRKLLFAVIPAVALLLTVLPAQAASDDEWRIIVAPYFFAMSADYDSTINGKTANVDLKFKDILDDFDVLGGSLRIEAWKGDFGIILDGIYTSLDGDFSSREGRFGQSAKVNAKLADTMIDLLGAYRILKGTLFDRPLIIDTWAGLRYHYLKQKVRLEVSGSGPLSGRAKRLGDSHDWVEPVIGGRVGWNFTEKWSLLTGADMGGFGIGSASDLTWSVTSLLNYQFSEHWSVAGGYRYFDMDYSRGSGKDEFGFDGSLDGIIIGVTWRN